MNVRSAFATPQHCSEPITVSTENVLSFLTGTPVRATAYKDSMQFPLVNYWTILDQTGPHLHRAFRLHPLRHR